MIRPFKNIEELKAKLDINDSMLNQICLINKLTQNVIFTAITSFEFCGDDCLKHKSDNQIRLLKVNNWTVEEFAANYMAKVNNRWVPCGIETGNSSYEWR